MFNLLIYCLPFKLPINILDVKNLRYDPKFKYNNCVLSLNNRFFISYDSAKSYFQATRTVCFPSQAGKSITKRPEYGISTPKGKQNKNATR